MRFCSRVLTTAFVGLGAALAAVQPAWAQPCSRERFLGEHDVVRESIALADLDLDGDADLIAVSDDAGTPYVAWFENDPDDLFTPICIALTDCDIDFLSGADEARVYAADVNGDDIPDILSASELGLVWYPSSGPYTEDDDEDEDVYIDFGRVVIGGSSSAPGPRFALPHDMDGDEDIDLIFAEPNGDGTFRLVWFENPGGVMPGPFAERQIDAAAPEVRSLAAGDIDGDTDEDVFVAPAMGAPVWYESDGAEPPAFAARDVEADGAGVAGATAVAIADVSNDGTPDLAVAGAPSELVWYEFDGPSGQLLERRIPHGGPGGALFLDAADRDGDGDIDLLAAHGNALNGWEIVWQQNDGATPPSFEPFNVARSSLEPQALAASDVNADGVEDAVTSYSVFGGLAHTVVGYEAASVRNTSTGLRYDVIGDAVDDAAPGDVLIGNPIAFAGACANLIDFEGKPITIAAAGDLERAPETRTILADSATLGSTDGSLRVSGALEVPPGVTATVRGRVADLSGEVAVAPGATLHVDAPALVIADPRFKPSLVGDTEIVFSLSSADVDADGLVDIFAVEIDRPLTFPLVGTLRMFRNVGGAPAAFEPILLQDDCLPLPAPGIADFDGDGDAEALSGCYDLGQIILYDIETEPEATVVSTVIGEEIPSGISGVTAADIDRDGDPDVLAIVGHGPRSIVLYDNLGGSPPAFDRRVLVDEFDPGAFDLRVGDIDGDGDPDIVSAGRGILWHENDGGAIPSFESTTVLSGCFACFNSRDADLFDFDGDGDLDVATSDPDIFALSWIENLGGDPPSFEEHYLQIDAVRTGPLFAADMNGDGLGDIVASSFDESVVRWYRNEGAGDGTFAPRIVAASSGFLGSVIHVDDVDLDGVPDVVASSSEAIGDRIEVLRNTPPLLTLAEGATFSASRAKLGGGVALQGGTIAAVPRVGPPVVLSSPGSLAGHGEISGSFVPRAPVRVEDGAGPGDLLVDGQFNVDGARGARLEVRVSDTDASRVDVAETARLEGTLRALAGEAFDPAVETYEVLTASSIEGRFDVAFLPSLPDRFLSVEYTAVGVRSDGRNASVLLRINPLDSDVEFDPAPSAGAEGGVPSAATLADVNLDGFVDLVMTVPDGVAPNQNPGSVAIFYNRGNGGDGSWSGFEDVAIVQGVFTGIGVQPDAVAVGDVNGDGIPDLVVANRGVPGNAAPDSVTVLINEPGASGAVAGVVDPFGVGQVEVIAVGDEPRDVVLADLDGDTLPEIVTANAGSDDVTVLWNSGSDPAPARAGDRAPNWRGAEEDDTTDPLELPEESCPLTIRPGEFDAGLVHLVVANTGLDSISFVRNDGGRTLTLLPPRPVDREPVQLVVADLDLDGAVDVVTVNRLGNGVSVLLNRADIGAGIDFSPSLDLEIDETPSFPRSIAAGDFDSDDDPDLAIVANGDALAGQPERIVKILRNDTVGGQLAFSPAADQLAGLDPLIVLSGDVNGDGRDDLVTVNESAPVGARGSADRADGSGVNVLVAAPAPCGGDVDGDGATTLRDLGILAANFGATGLPSGAGQSKALGDLDDDGDVDADDFNALAEHFGCDGR